MKILKTDEYISEKLDIQPVTKERLDNIQDEIRQNKKPGDKDIDRIQKTLDDNGVSAEVWIETPQDPQYVCVQIEGDWKHEHGFSKELITELGYKLHRVTQTSSDDGSDWYEAIYFYNK